MKILGFVLNGVFITLVLDGVQVDLILHVDILIMINVVLKWCMDDQCGLIRS